MKLESGQLRKWDIIHFRRLNDTFDKDLDLTIAAYNAGPTNVQSWLENRQYSSDGKSVDYIPFGETKKYVDKVNTYYNIYQYLYNKKESYFDGDKVVDLIKSFLNVYLIS